ncbi:hypothetical protein WA016_06954 [Myxococcus stipitatus]
MEFKREHCSTYRPDNPQGIWLVTNTPLAGPWWLEQTHDRRILEVVSDCLGHDIDFQMGFARIRPPGHHNFCSWHQDWTYDRHTTPGLVTALTYLDETTAARGSTWVVPSSHLQGEWHHEGPAFIAEERLAGRGMPVEASPGDVLLLHVLTVHRAGGNAGNHSIRVLLNQYKSASAYPLSKSPHALRGLPLHRAESTRHASRQEVSPAQRALGAALALGGPATPGQLAKTLLRDNPMLYLRLGGLEGVCRTLTQAVRSQAVSVAWGRYFGTSPSTFR